MINLQPARGILDEGCIEHDLHFGIAAKKLRGQRPHTVEPSGLSISDHNIPRHLYRIDSGPLQMPRTRSADRDQAGEKVRVRSREIHRDVAAETVPGDEKSIVIDTQMLLESRYQPQKLAMKFG